MKMDKPSEYAIKIAMDLISAAPTKRAPWGVALSKKTNSLRTYPQTEHNFLCMQESRDDVWRVLGIYKHPDLYELAEDVEFFYMMEKEIRK